MSFPINNAANGLLKFKDEKNLPLILQTEIAECGLACLAMVAGYHGYQTDLVALRRRFSISAQGVNLHQLMSMANKLNMISRPLRAEIEGLKKITLPCILHWGMNHFVVLKEIKKDKFILHDPAFGERILVTSEFDKYFTGVALELTPDDKFVKKNDTDSIGFKDFFGKISGIKRSLTLIILLSLLLQFFMLAGPFYLQIVIDDVLVRKDTNLLIVLAIGFGLLLFIQLVTTYLRELTIIHLSNRLGIQISSNLFRHLIRLPMDYFSKRHVGDIISRFRSLTNVRLMLTNGMVVAMVDGIMAILTLVAMFIYSSRLAFIVLAVVLAYGFLRWLLYRPLRVANEEAIIAEAKESSHFMESVRAIQTIKIFQREHDREHQWLNRLVEMTNKKIQISKLNVNYNILNLFLFGVENIIIIYFAATAVMGNMMSLGMLYAFLSYKDRFIRSIDNLIAQLVEYKLLDIHFNRLADIAHTEREGIYEEAELYKDSQEVNLISGKIEVKNLGFRYSENEPFVFRNVNLIINSGENVAITGNSGSGKTTLLKCLMGLISPTEGEIWIDDKPLNKVSDYRRQIAGVMQEDRLMMGDIAENICCFNPHLDMQKIEHYAELACINTDIQKMPMKYNTLVGDMGGSLSGGQKQRVILARALYREPRIIFMDEATSHLDASNEKAVNENLNKLNITRVLVAHRSETIQSTDRIILLGS